MAGYGSFMYRRNGRYYARLRIPRCLQLAYGRTHLRSSLNTSDLHEARLRVHEVVLGWRREFLRLMAMLDVHRVFAGSPLLLVDGLIQVNSAARESGIPATDMLREALRMRSELRVAARAWVGTEVPREELEFDVDGTFIVDSADGLVKTVITGELFLSIPRHGRVHGELRPALPGVCSAAG